MSHAMIFALLLRPPKMILQDLPALVEDEDGNPEPCCRANTREVVLQSMPKVFMLLGWIGIMGGHLFQIAITPVRAGYMGIPEMKGAMLVSILGQYSLFVSDINIVFICMLFLVVAEKMNVS